MSPAVNRPLIHGLAIATPSAFCATYPSFFYFYTRLPGALLLPRSDPALLSEKGRLKLRIRVYLRREKPCRDEPTTFHPCASAMPFVTNWRKLIRCIEIVVFL